MLSNSQILSIIVSRQVKRPPVSESVVISICTRNSIPEILESRPGTC